MGWEDLPQYLSNAGVKWDVLERAAKLQIELDWRGIYGPAFIRLPRHRVGHKAEHEFAREPCTHYLIVPFTSDVPRIPMHIQGRGKRTLDAYECEGPLVALGEFCQAEFFVAPLDLSWTMVHTHEDHALGGPYFIRREWLV